RGFFGSFLEFGTLSGYAAGTAIMLFLETVLTAEQMSAWGWRVPFLLALPLGLVGFYLPSRLEDTPIFQELKEDHVHANLAGSTARQDEEPTALETLGLTQLVKQYWQPLLIVAAWLRPSILSITRY